MHCGAWLAVDSNNKIRTSEDFERLSSVVRDSVFSQAYDSNSRAFMRNRHARDSVNQDFCVNNIIGHACASLPCSRGNDDSDDANDSAGGFGSHNFNQAFVNRGLAMRGDSA